ncbi:hypothetical protein [Sinomicrobium soli]|uniref:hypothetical protein n=1 Tax=Sinomicrobium sp. N-1-3-6 TaxID=2219864 RepID=UPI000DCF3617|nr:hypothetical protein [Sinomicrobium sp. N-1-3-6]RAV28252.1 hypothetical protein DN748_13895 [Sinomicrobium sp. N-1-3-6]
MRFVFIILIHIITVSHGYSQNMANDTLDVMAKVLFDNIDYSLKPNYYITCVGPETHFTKKSFLTDSELSDIPMEVLEELETNARGGKAKVWCSGFLKTLLKNYDTILNPSLFPQKTCITLSPKDIQKARNDHEYRIAGISGKIKDIIIFTLHTPVFDNNKEHCVVSVVSRFYIFGFQSFDYFLKKVYGKWVIISKFNYVIS